MDVEKINIRVTPKWKHSKEEIWDSTFEPLVQKGYQGNHWMPILAYSLVATMVVCLLIGSLYQKEIHVDRGEQLVVSLPDRSRVELNSASYLTYRPLLWFVYRTVHLEGEAYFEVTKGKKFTVTNPRGEIKVLGTKFNAYMRKDGFHVSCLTGKVAVSSSDQKVVLTPSMEVRLINNTLKTTQVQDISSSIVWTQQAFSFRHVPLSQVINELMRRYDVRLEVDGDIHHFYTAKFVSDTPINDILNAIESTFDVTIKVIE